MKRKILSFLFIFLLIISIILPLRGSVRGQNPVDNSLKIFAIMYNSLEIGDDEKGEAVCLMNTGSNTIDISNYKITDFEGSVIFPSSTYVALSVRIWITREATEFYKEFGFKPNFEYGKDTDPTVPNLAQDNGAFPIFDNGGDECAVFDPSGNIVDVVAWGTSDYANTGWIGGKINPYIFASYISADGDIVYRKLDEATVQPIADTNTASDWSWDPNDPISGCKIMYPGWDTWDLFPRTVKHSGTVTTTFALSPDNAFYALRDAIRSAQSSIKIELYTITSLELMQEILNKMDQGVKVKVLMDGEVYGTTGGTYDQVRWFVTQVVNKGGTAYFLRNPQGSSYPHDRYNNVHIKTIIIDDSKVFISADNLTGSSMPSDDLSDGTAGNRGATVLTNDPVIVQGVLKIFNHDFNIGYYDVSPYNPATDAPPSSYYPYRWGNHSGYMPVQPQPLTVTEYEELELVQSPDTSIKGTEGIIGLINKAGAGDLIIDEAQYEDLYWGPSGSQYINPRLQAMISAAQRGAQVYLLLDSVNSASTNTPTKAYMEAQSSNIHVLLGNPTSGTGSFPIHNKMILARIGGKGYVNIASINGSENASRANRELGIIIQSNAGFEYYYKAICL
jgi:phosphatidylserine/phosphatidylglycerophosphate/cardiolipin synthase-like enzyme